VTVNDGATIRSDRASRKSVNALKPQGRYQFTQFVQDLRITVASEADIPAAEKIIHHAGAQCLITNSMKGRVEIRPVIVAATLQLAFAGRECDDQL
jgi:organic hydroperoxide reductase OsmC/OhrA